MKTRPVGVAVTLAALVAVIWLLPAGLAAQKATGPKAGATKGTSTLPRTPWGDPDLQGTWTNQTTTPLERLPEAQGKADLTEEERAALAQQVAARLDQDRAKPRQGEVIAYNELWYERGTLINRTSLIVDPPDGRIPPFTPAGQKRWDAVLAARVKNAADSWLDKSAYDRCIARGMPGAMLPGFYNHNYQILQTPGYVAIVVEMIHDARIVPLDGRAHLNAGVRQWLGDSVGHWDGNTLVVETTNLNDKVFDSKMSVVGFGKNMRMIERFTRVDADTIDYRFTIDDPTTFTRPWTVSAPMSKMEGPIYEYACHEGNHAMTGILGGARADDEKAVAEAAGKQQK